MKYCLQSTVFSFSLASIDKHSLKHSSSSVFHCDWMIGVNSVNHPKLGGYHDFFQSHFYEPQNNSVPRIFIRSGCDWLMTMFLCVFETSSYRYHPTTTQHYCMYCRENGTCWLYCRAPLTKQNTLSEIIILLIPNKNIWRIYILIPSKTPSNTLDNSTTSTTTLLLTL